MSATYAAWLAAADQELSAYREGLVGLISEFQGMLADGVGSTEAIATLTTALAASPHHKAAALAAVAIADLAERDRAEVT